MLEQFDRLPHPGDSIEVEGYVFRVQSMRGRRVAMLRVEAPEPLAPAEEDKKEDAGSDGTIGDVSLLSRGAKK